MTISFITTSRIDIFHQGSHHDVYCHECHGLASIKQSTSSRTTTTDNDDNDNDDSSQNYYTFHGMESVTHLLNHHYKVQLLSASDFWNNDNLRETQGPGVFLPNSLITKDNLESFFIWGAQAAATSRACVVAQEEDIKTTSMRPPPIFKAFLFATQGLDLAIPSRREYLNASMHPKVPWFFPYNDKPHALRQMADSVILKPCPQQHRLQIKFLPKGKDDEVVDKELNTWDVLEINVMVIL
ncbi:hypothetical protein MHU86_22279 [Fragilaria crotonensis]|nr:hypothetical protein MHU86_22279 [Fragilaria crotonensis]